MQSRLALEVMGSHGRLGSRSHRVYERRVLCLQPGSEKGSRRGTFKRCSEGQAETVIMEEGEQGPGHPSAILFGSVARWAQDAEARNPGPGPSSLLCVLGHGA